jgi:ankyrin repeat protein
MASISKLIIRIIIVNTMLCSSGSMFSQVSGISWAKYDTSMYIPSMYKGATDYNLMIAASKGYTMEIERLILKGADIDAEADGGATPLIFAVSNNKEGVVRLLIRYGADVNKITSEFETPLLIAVKNENQVIAEALLRAGADIHFSDKYDATALHYASIYGYLQLTDMLLYYNASIDKKTVEGITPLLASVGSGWADVADLLIQNGANMEARDNEGFTPFLMASLNGDTLLMDLLYKKGVDIYTTNIYKHNALTLSIIANQPDATKYLLRIGDKWAVPGKDFENPYSVASKYRRKEMINILKSYNVPGELKFQIDQVAINASSRFCLHDLYTGVSLSFKEPYLNAGFIAGCDVKFWYTRILVKDSEHLFHQYMDKGSMAYAGLFKDFALTDHLNKLNYTISSSLLGGYSFGNKLKGTLVTPENKFMIIPSVSLKLMKMNFSSSIGMEYLRSGYYKTGPIWLRISFSYNYFFDEVRSRFKTIRWY